MSINQEIVRIAKKIKPDQATLVPEKRQELTTEGGLDVKANPSRIKKVVEELHKKNIDVSLFIDPDESQIRASKKIGARIIELHTGNYAQARAKSKIKGELKRLKDAVLLGESLGLIVNAGHGLTYQNARPVAEIPNIEELNIGHSIISRAVIVGLDAAVRQMKALIK
jgi:pyridoxine 5-phosphate synthase